MEFSERIEAAISRALEHGRTGPAPKRLAGAMEHAVFPGGARIRPTLLLGVAAACGESRPDFADRAAAALELIHCASLVHDDMPCFDDADTRRGKPTVHRAYGEPLALLCGDSLIVMAFEVLAGLAPLDPARGAALVLTLAQRTGVPGGICAGQGWESESEIDLSAYHSAKTGALFVAATRMGAISAGHDPEAWEELGQRIGGAFQIADDLRDALYDSERLGKPVRQDKRHGRPNAVAEYGVEGAIARMKDSLGGAIASIPSCPGEGALAQMVQKYALRLAPGADVRPTVPGE